MKMLFFVVGMMLHEEQDMQNYNLTCSFAV
jgi:hypothetical protein